jgi:glycosyltransferase involved in cell wall biosynthesis
LKDRVTITGWVNSDRVRDEIVKSRALVMPSFAEGLPVAIMESLALHRPVISTYIAAIPELVQPGVCGWLVPPGSVDDLTDAMRDALRAPQADLDRMGAAGAARVAERHDVTIEVSKLAKLIDQSLSVSSAPPEKT